MFEIVHAEIAQLVEHFPEEEGVAGSNPALGTIIRLLLESLVYTEWCVCRGEASDFF